MDILFSSPGLYGIIKLYYRHIAPKPGESPGTGEGHTMKKRNRVLALTVAAAMSASLLAGCGSSAQQGGAASSEAASTDTAASVSDGGEDNIIRVGVVCSMTG